MAGNRKFHNKFHSANHHTLPSPHIIDSGLDPVASHDFPFIGDFVLNGTISSSNNYSLNNGGTRAGTLDSVLHGLPVPAGWNVFRDSTYIDGDVTITGNLSALGELTYLHTQVHVTSATEIEVHADNSNGKTVGLLVDQHGSNDVVHIKNDNQSTLLITGSAAGDESRGGWMGINLSSLSARGITRPNQRMTIVGSVSVVPDPIEVADQSNQKDPGTTGSLYIEGGLHVNDATYLDQVTIDTTDGKFLVSGDNNDGNANIFEVEVPTHLDKTHIDTSDGDFVVSGSKSMNVDVPTDHSGHTDLDSTHIDTSKGNFVVSGSNKVYINAANGLDVNTFTTLDRTHISTIDGSFIVDGPNTVVFDNTGGLEVQHHTKLDRVTIDTTDGQLLVSGSGTPGSENAVNIDVPTELDRVTIDTTDGQLLVSGSGTPGSENNVNIDVPIQLDKVTVDTTDGQFLVSGSGDPGTENIVNIDVPTELDKTTIDTTDGKFLITGTGSPGTENIVDVDVPIELDKTTINTNDGDLNIVGDNAVLVSAASGVTIDNHTQLNQLTVNTNTGKMLIEGGNVLDVEVDASFIDNTLSARNVIIDTINGGGNLLVRGSGRVDFTTEAYFDNPVEMDRVTIDTSDGEFVVTNPATNFLSRSKMRVNVPAIFQSLTASSDHSPIIFEGSNETVFNTETRFNSLVTFNGTLEIPGAIDASTISISGVSDLSETKIDTSTGDFVVSGTGSTQIQTPTTFTRDVHVQGDLRVDGNAYLSAGAGGIINVGDTSDDNIIFYADIDSSVLPNITNIYSIGSTSQRWLNFYGVSGTVDYLYSDKRIEAAGDLNVDGVTTLDEVNIDTTDGEFVVSGDNRTHIHTNLSTHDDLSATGGPWRFTNFDEIKYSSPGYINYEGIDNWETGAVLNHPFRVDERSLFNQGLTALGPVQIGELPTGVTDELPEPTFEVLGNMHLRDGNLKIDSDIRHLEDENTLMRFSPDKIEFRAGDAPLLTLTENPSEVANDSVQIGDNDSPADLTLYKDLNPAQPGLTYDSTDGNTEIHGNVGIYGPNEAASVIGDGLDVHGSVRVTETLSARNLIVDYITVQESSFGNIGGQVGGAAEMSTLSGVALSGHVTEEWVNGITQSFTGTEVGISFDLEEDDQGDIQKLFSFTFEALSANPLSGIKVGDTQTVTYQFAAKWDQYYTQAFVNDVEYGILHTSDVPFVETGSVVLSALDVPTNERIVKIIVDPAVDIKFYAHNVLVQDKPRRLDTVTTADFDVNGGLTINGRTSASGDIVTKSDLYVSGGSIVQNNLWVKGDLRVDGNAFLSAGSSGVINVGDTASDSVVFNADIHSSFIPEEHQVHNLGSTNAEWKTLHIQDVSASNNVYWNGGSSLLSNSVYTDVSETSADWNSVYTDVSETSAEWNSVYTDVSETSAEWNSVYTDVSETSAEWNSVYTDVSETSAEWNSVYTDVSETSADWNSVYTDVSETSAEWNSVYTDVSETSAEWNSVYTDVSETSAEWNSVYTDVSETSAEWNSVYTDVSETSAEWNSVYTDVSETSAEWNSVYTDVSKTSAEWNSVYTDVSETSAEWNDVYSWVNSDSATNNTEYNQTQFVNASGDTINGSLYITGDLRVDGNTYLSGGTGGVISVGDDADDIVSFNADIGSNITPEMNGVFDIGTSTQAWRNIHTTGDITWNNGSSLDSNSVYSFVNTTSGDEGYATLSAYRDNRFVLRHDQVPDLAITNVFRVTNSSLVVTLQDDIHRGDIVLVNDTEDNIIAVADHPTGSYDTNTHEYYGYEKLFAPGNMVRFINGKQGPSVTFTTDDFDFSTSTNKFVLQSDIDTWNSNYNSVSSTSGNWDSVYTSVNNASAGWDNTQSTVELLSASWEESADINEVAQDLQELTTTVSATSAEWDSVYSSVCATSGEWNSVYTDVSETSADWNSVYTDVSETSAEWNSVYTDVSETSADWNSVYTDVSETSADWNSVYTDVSETSADWNSVYTDVSETSADWNSVYTDVSETSGEWNSVYTDVSETSADWNSVYTDVSETSADWNSVYTDVSETSANWNSVYTDVSETSADWNSVYTDVSETSADWNSVYTDVSETSAEWDSVYTDVSETSAEWDSVYSWVNSDSATNNTDYNQTHFVNASGDEMTGSLSVNGTISASGDLFVDGSVWFKGDNSGEIKLGDQGTDKVIFTASVSSDITPTVDSIFNIGTSAAQWSNIHSNNINISQDLSSRGLVHLTGLSDGLLAGDIVSHQVNGELTVSSLTVDEISQSTTVVSNTSADWNSVYSYINTASGDYGIATLGANGKLDEALVPNLSISEVYVVTYSSQVSALCNGSLQGPVNIERGDVVIVTTDEHSLISLVDQPTGIYSQGFDTFAGFSKLSTATDFIKTINGKQGYNVIINPDDLDDTNTAHKFVTDLQRDNWDSVYNSVCATSAEWDSVYTDVSETSAEWDSVYSWVNSDSATNNTDYNQTHFVNASGDTITGPLSVTGATDLTSTLSVTGATDLTSTLSVTGLTDVKTLSAVEIGVSENVSVSGDVHIKGDLRVDGNTYLSAGAGGDINVGDSADDNIIFNADVNSNILPNTNDAYDLGSVTQKWSNLHTVSAHVGEQDIHNLNVTGVTNLSGKSDQGPGVIITGTPTGIFDVNTPGFEDRDSDYLIPDVDITGDVVLHGSLSADNAHIYSLTASNFKAEYQKLVVNDGDLELWNGNIRQRGGNVLVESDIAHIDDENTYIRFQPDQLKIVAHDLNMIQFNEYPLQDDIIIIADDSDAVDIRIQNPSDLNTFFINGDNAYIGIGTNNPLEKLHVATGQVQLATGDADGALMITSGSTQERVDKTGSIRWNSDLNRYEGYLSDINTWQSFNGIGDTDGDTYIDIDAEAADYPDSDVMSLYTAGCSAMTVYPDQTVSFAGDIQFDNITVYDNDSVTGPLSASSEFIYLKVNGKDRAIRLWHTPADTRQDLTTIHGENITEIGDDCGLGLFGDIPMQTISAQNVLTSPPTQ